MCVCSELAPDGFIYWSQSSIIRRDDKRCFPPCPSCFPCDEVFFKMFLSPAPEAIISQAEGS